MSRRNKEFTFFPINDRNTYVRNWQSFETSSKLFLYYRGNPDSLKLTKPYFSGENKSIKLSGKLKPPKETTPIDKAIFSKEVYDSNFQSQQSSYQKPFVNPAPIRKPIKVIKYQSEDAIKSTNQEKTYKVNT